MHGYQVGHDPKVLSAVTTTSSHGHCTRMSLRLPDGLLSPCTDYVSSAEPRNRNMWESHWHRIQLIYFYFAGIQRERYRIKYKYKRI